jgi:ketosteroid isomerase-like protein
MSNGDVIRGLYEAFGRGDVPEVLGTFDPAIEWREADNFLYAAGNPYIGPGAVAEGVFMRIVGDVDGFTVVPQRFTEGGDTVVVEGRYRGIMKATGIPVDAQFVHVWQIAGGKIAKFQQYTDTKQWADAVAPAGV